MNKTEETIEAVGEADCERFFETIMATTKTTREIVLATKRRPLSAGM
jgi:hypothetical protein